MNIENILCSASGFYSDTHDSLINHLLKFSNQIEFSSDDKNLPLLIFKKKDIYLWIKDTDVSDFPFLFSDPEEILFILYQFLSSGKNIYLSKKLPPELSEEEIRKNIESSLLNNDISSFNHWVTLLKNKQ